MVVYLIMNNSLIRRIQILINIPVTFYVKSQTFSLAFFLSGSKDSDTKS